MERPRLPSQEERGHVVVIVEQLAEERLDLDARLVLDALRPAVRIAGDIRRILAGSAAQGNSR
jgi:hypothetical protein